MNGPPSIYAGGTSIAGQAREVHERAASAPQIEDRHIPRWRKVARDQLAQIGTARLELTYACWHEGLVPAGRVSQVNPLAEIYLTAHGVVLEFHVSIPPSWPRSRNAG